MKYCYCSLHGLKINNKKRIYCKYCDRQFSHFCPNCELWYSDINHTCQIHIERKKDEIYLYFMCYGETTRCIVNKHKYISHLKRFYVDKINNRYECNMYYVTTYDNILCLEDRKIGDCFNDGDFIKMNEKDYISYYFDKFINYITRNKEEDKGYQPISLFEK